jgi:hypothetical protein
VQKSKQKRETIYEIVLRYNPTESRCRFFAIFTKDRGCYARLGYIMEVVVGTKKERDREGSEREETGRSNLLYATVF